MFCKLYSNWKGRSIMDEIDSKNLFHKIGQNVKYYRKLYNLDKGKMTQ